MTHPSKRKGNRFEQELVCQATEAGLKAKRAYASNGESLGLGAEVDLVIEGKPIQAKRRARIASYIKIPKDCQAVIFREDRGETFVIMSLEQYFTLVKGDGKKPDALSSS